MISVIIEDEAVWFSFLTLNHVLAFVSAAVKPAQAGSHLACLHRLLRPASRALCAQKECVCVSEESVLLAKMDSEERSMA